MSNLSTFSALLVENVKGSPVDLMFRKTDLIQLIGQFGGRYVRGYGSAPYKWTITTAVNSGVGTFVEGQAPGVPGAQTFQKPSLDVFGVEANWTMTGHQLANAANGGYYAEPALEEVLARSDFMKKVEDLLCGSVQDQGIASIIDKDDTYATLAPGSVAQWASYEVAVGGALTVSVIDDMYEALTSASSSGVARGASPNVILVNPRQLKKYNQLAGAPGAANNSIRVMPNGTNGFDPSFNWMGSTYQGIPVARVRTLANNELYMLDMTDFELIEHRPISVDKVSTNPELMQWRASALLALKVEKRSQHGKLTGLST